MKLTREFQELFEWEKVGRKWQTLVDAYKKVIDNNNSTGRGTTKFQFFEEMGELLGSRHDINFPITGTAQQVTISRPEEVETAPTSPETPTTSRKRKRKADEDVLVNYLRESDEAAERRQTQLVDELGKQQAAFLSMFEKVCSKMSENKDK
jgi:hypothetical protein